MSARLVRCSDVAPAPWRNGGGVTRELLAWPAADDWRVRISVADIAADGPFSSFPSATRWFAVLDGAGVELTIDGSPRRCTPLDPPVRFSGAASTRCRLLDGPTRDLNLMLRGVGGTMQAVASGMAWQPDDALLASGIAEAARQAGVYARVAGRCTSGDADIDVPADTLLWIDPAPLAMRFTAGSEPPGAVGWWIGVTGDGRFAA